MGGGGSRKCTRACAGQRRTARHRLREAEKCWPSRSPTRGLRRPRRSGLLGCADVQSDAPLRRRALPWVELMSLSSVARHTPAAGPHGCCAGGRRAVRATLAAPAWRAAPDGERRCRRRRRRPSSGPPPCVSALHHAAPCDACERARSPAPLDASRLACKPPRLAARGWHRRATLGYATTRTRLQRGTRHSRPTTEEASTHADRVHLSMQLGGDKAPSRRRASSCARALSLSVTHSPAGGGGGATRRAAARRARSPAGRVAAPASASDCKPYRRTPAGKRSS